MTDLTCADCGKTGIKNMGSHKRFCKTKPLIEKIQDNKPDIKMAMTQEPVPVSPSPVPVDPTHSLLSRIKKVQNGIKVAIIGEAPINPKPDPNFKPIESSQEARIKQFLADMPRWSYDASTWIQRTLLHAKSGMVYKTVVFVGEGNDCTRAYLPYDERKKRLVIDKAGYYQVECKGDVIFLDKEKLLPLKDAPDLSRFQNSANYVWSVYNGGYQEGLSQRFDELMEEINKERMLKYICMVVAILSLIALVGVSYFDGKSIDALVAQNANQFAQIANVTRRLANYE